MPPIRRLWSAAAIARLVRSFFGLVLRAISGAGPESRVTWLILCYCFGCQSHLADVGGYQDVEHINYLLVLNAVVPPDNDVQIRVLLAKLDERVEKLVLRHLVGVEKDFAAVIHGNVIDLGGGILGPAGGGRERDVQLVDSRGGGDKEDHQ